MLFALTIRRSHQSTLSNNFPFWDVPLPWLNIFPWWNVPVTCLSAYFYLKMCPSPRSNMLDTGKMINVASSYLKREERILGKGQGMDWWVQWLLMAWKNVEVPTGFRDWGDLEDGRMILQSAKYANLPSLHPIHWNKVGKQPPSFKTLIINWGNIAIRRSNLIAQSRQLRF